MPGGRPAKPMFPALAGTLEDCADGALSFDDAATFCGICKREIERAIGRGELETLYHGRKPVVPKRQLVIWLARKLEAARIERQQQPAPHRSAANQK